jgi:ATP-dependent Clp protease, protease subunit
MSNFRVRMAGNKTGELFIYDDIGGGFFGGIGAKHVADEVNGLGKIETLNVRLNSAGGDVFEGLAIYNFLNRHPARVVVDVDGMALSIASIIAMAGDEIRIADNAMMMIHDPWTMAVGSSDDFRTQADLMDQVKENLVGVYADRTKRDRGDLSSLMSEETWLTAADAVEMGFADAVTENLKIAARFDPTRFKNSPKNFATTNGPKPNPLRAKLAEMQRRAKAYAPAA